MSAPFTEFFFELRRRQLKVGLNEWLALLRALQLNLHESSLTGFYHLSRCVLVHREADLDRFDQAFAF